MSKKLYMVIETFKAGDAIAVYRRFRDRGRLTPAGLGYISSWVTEDLCRCYQLMETDDPELSIGGWETGATSSILRCAGL